MARKQTIILTGDKEIDAKIKQMVSQTSAKGVNAAARKGTRAGAKIVLNDAKAMAPVDEGTLERSLTVRTAAKGSKRRNTIGHAVTTKPGVFESGKFYGGYLEYGTKKMEADEYMRPALYGNESRVRSAFLNAIKSFVSSAGR